MENKTVLICVAPYWGHVNPILGVAEELVNRKANVIFYSLDEMKNAIEKTGAEYRRFPIFRTINLTDLVNDPDFLLKGSRFSIEFAIESLGVFSKVAEEENIDLIIYDQYSLSIKFLVNHLNYKYKNGKRSKPAPPVAIFSPSFVFRDNAYPFTAEEKALTLYSNEPEFVKQFDVLQEEQEILNQKHDMDIKDVYKLMSLTEEKLVLVSILRELHPHSELFPESYSFVGPCFAKGRNETIKDTKLQSFLDLFQPINPRNSVDELHNENNLKLIFVSLGTVFNENVGSFETIIEAIKAFDEGDKDKLSEVKSSQLRVVFSVGEVSATKLKEKIDKNELTVPNNILILSSGPQLAILKRASVFITHCGMNSTSEGLHLGVPLICVPVVGDQPLVAYRVSEELNLSKRFDILKLTADGIKEEIHEIFKNKSRQEKVLEFARISNKYDGIQKSAELIEKYLA